MSPLRLPLGLFLAAGLDAARVASVRLFGHKALHDFKHDAQDLHFQFPPEAPCKHACEPRFTRQPKPPLDRTHRTARQTPPSLCTGLIRCLLPPLLAVVAVPCVSAAPDPATDPDGWGGMAAILKRIVPPTFPARDFLLTDFGAVGDGVKDCRAAFARAIAACTGAGGGRVVVPPGWFYCDGPIHLASNVNLHVTAGATIKFGIEHDKYLPVVLTRFEGTVFYGHSPRIYVRGATNVALTGKGIIDGSGRASLDLPRKKSPGSPGALRSLAEKGVPIEKRIYGSGNWVRPSMIQFYECTNVLIEDITVLDSTFWCIHPVFCRNVTVRGVAVESMNGNNDGCDPDSCVDVLIENCKFRTGDDSIAIKSGRDLDGRQIARPSENVVIRHVDMGSRHSGLCIGSEMSGGVRNVFMEDCTGERVSSAIYFKGNLDRGGIVEHVRVRRVHVKEVRDGLVRFETTYRAQDLRGGNVPPIFRDYIIEDVSCQVATGYGLSIEGLEGAPIRDVVLRRAKVEKAKIPYRIARTENVRFQDVVINGQLLPALPRSTPIEGVSAGAKQPKSDE